ncbi:MAG: PilW family protein [gamma proteobacterium endosymbiont of Lamellibrachia anaximandri]|nr:PilW family protein [gamma proteobacterium endosymbiont of Lamellibrachia anaximandri]MBL3533808.1 PilW family protein [gamma proteobacterium endosymbiont of Lamellibrachia anaximandri]
MRDTMINRRHNQGLTLVELMIAIVLSLILMAGATSIFMASKQTFNLEEDVSRVQENMRYVANRFSNDLAGGGFYGCFPSNRSSNTTVTNTVTDNGTANPTLLYDFSQVISGVDGGTVGGVELPDQVAVHFALAGTEVPMNGTMGTQVGDVPVDANAPNYADLSRGDIVSVSDCNAVAVFLITAVPAGSLNHDASTTIDSVSNFATGIEHVFGHIDYSSASVYKMDAVHYELRTQTAGGLTTSGLYATRLGDANPQLLIAGVEDFQVSYGIDLNADGTADRFVDWDAVGAAINDVTSLHVTLTINPGDPVAQAQGRDANYTRDLDFTVKLRNRDGDI